MTPADPEPRRRRLSADARRAQLVEATVDVVAAAGMLAAGSDAIAERAGVSKGLLWHYFDTFDALLLATAEYCFTVLGDAVIGSVDREHGVPALLRSAISAAARLPATHRHEIEALRQIALNLRGPDGALLLDESAHEPLYAAQEALLRGAQQAGELRADLDPRLLSVVYQNAVDSMIEHLVKHPDVDPQRYARQLADVLLCGMQADGSS